MTIDPARHPSHRDLTGPPSAAPSGPTPGLGLEREARHHRGHGAHTHDHAQGRRSIVEVRQDLLAANDSEADVIRRQLATHGVVAINLMSSPGSGKTSLLEATLSRLGGELRLGIIEGDIETTADADRLAPYGAPVVQINTGPFGGDCHLAAPLVARALENFDLHDLDLLVVENVGNLVCPAEFDIGEDAKVVLLSVTEGEDKPLKYPLMFHEASFALVTKIDLLPYLDTDVDLIRQNVARVNPGLSLLMVSTKTGEGLDDWIGWLRHAVRDKREAAARRRAEEGSQIGARPERPPSSAR